MIHSEIYFNFFKRSLFKNHACIASELLFYSVNRKGILIEIPIAIYSEMYRGIILGNPLGSFRF